jgi:hypothetical protein
MILKEAVLIIFVLRQGGGARPDERRLGAEQIGGNSGAGADKFVGAGGKAVEDAKGIGPPGAGDEKGRIEFGIGAGGEREELGDDGLRGRAKAVASFQRNPPAISGIERIKIQPVFVGRNPGREQSPQQRILPIKPFTDERKRGGAKVSDGVAGFVVSIRRVVVQKAKPDIQRRAVIIGAGQKTVVKHDGDGGGDHRENN